MRPSNRRSRLLASMIFALSLNAACDLESTQPLNVILISIDTLRADRLGAYGYERPTSPQLDAFAGEGVLFERAVAECSWTLPSHVTMLSGLHPATHAVVKPALRIGADTPLLAERLEDAGYVTIGLTGGGYVGSAHGFARGFDVYEEAEVPFQDAVSDAIGRLTDLDARERFFLFLHTYDVHCPYAPAVEYADLFRSPNAAHIETEGRCGNPHFNTTVLRPGQPEHISDQYDGSIREVDAALGKLFAFLEESGRRSDTIVIVTSDHGEELNEHGRFGHERSLYKETLMVPLAIVAPGLKAARVGTPVGLADIVPTVLAMLDIPAPTGTEGRALLERDDPIGWRAAALGDVARHSELDRHIVLRSVMSGDHHLIVNPRANRAELYSIGDDPLEAVDLAAGHPGTVAALNDSIVEHRSGRTPRAVDTLTSLSDEERARLRSLGYIN